MPRGREGEIINRDTGAETSTGVRGIAHACFIVSDLERSVRFYRGALGLAEAFSFTDDEGRRVGVYLRVGGRNFIELFEAIVGPPSEAQSFQHICLEVDDLPATVAHLRDRGVEVSDPVLGTDNSWQAWLTDPDRNRIELHAYTPGSLQAPWLDGSGSGPGD